MEEGYPPLPDAAWNGWVDTVRALLRQGAEVDARNNEGYTPLRYAADCGKADIVGALLDEGADPGIRDARGTSALDVIVQKARNGDQAFKNVVEFLKRTRPECVFDFWVTNK
jgi:ankyrin repeat protein